MRELGECRIVLIWGRWDGSDAHFVQEIGNGLTLIPEDCRTWQDILAAICAGRTQSTGKRARYLRHVARGHLRTTYQYQRERLRRHGRKSILI